MVQNIAEIRKNWTAPKLPALLAEIPHGDMPGDKVEIGEGHIAKANTIFPVLLQEIETCQKAGQQKTVIAVCGGSGVGKSETASLLAYYLNEAGISGGRSASDGSGRYFKRGKPDPAAAASGAGG